MGIACVQFQLFDAGKKASFVDGPTKIYKLGYFWWDMDGYCLELQYIRFAQQIFIPPNNLVTGYGWNFIDGTVRGNFTITYTKLNELPVDVIGQAIGLASGRLDGLRKLGLTGLEGPVPTATKQGRNQRLKGYISN